MNELFVLGTDEGFLNSLTSFSTGGVGSTFTTTAVADGNGNFVRTGINVSTFVSSTDYAVTLFYSNTRVALSNYNFNIKYDDGSYESHSIDTTTGDTWPFEGSDFVELASADVDSAYYLREFTHPLTVEGTISLQKRSADRSNTKFTGYAAHPFPIDELPAVDDLDFGPGTILRLASPQGPFTAEPEITFGADGLFYGYSTQPIAGFVTAAIGVSSKTLNNNLLGILVESGERSQIYVIGNGGVFTNELTHILIDNNAYHLSSSVRTSGGVHFKLVEDGEGNPLRNGDSPLSDAVDSTIENISIRHANLGYIGDAVATHDVGTYQKSEDGTVWDRVYISKSSDPSNPIYHNEVIMLEGGGGLIATTHASAPNVIKDFTITPRSVDGRIWIDIQLISRGNHATGVNNAGIAYKLTYQIGSGTETDLLPEQEEYEAITGDNITHWHRTFRISEWHHPSTTEEITYRIYANRILVAGETSMPMRITHGKLKFFEWVQ